MHETLEGVGVKDKILMAIFCLCITVGTLVFITASFAFAEEKQETDWKAKYEQLATDYLQVSNTLNRIRGAYVKMQMRLAEYENNEQMQKAGAIQRELIQFANEKKIKEITGEKDKPVIDNSDPAAIHRN